MTAWGCVSESEPLVTVYTTNTAGVGSLAPLYTWNRDAVALSTTTSQSSIQTSSPSSKPSISRTGSSRTTSSVTESASPDSSFDVLALALSLGTILSLALLALIGFLVYRYRKRRSSQQRPSQSDVKYNPVLTRPNFSSAEEKSWSPTNTTELTSSAMFNRSHSNPWRQERFEVEDHKNLAAYPLGMHQPSEADCQSRFEFNAGHVSSEADSGKIHEVDGRNWK